MQKHVTKAMTKLAVWMVLGLAWALALISAVNSKDAPPLAKAPVAQDVAERVDVNVLKGAWVRPDGGYVIAIKNVDSNGQLEAVYFNPTPLPFARAQASLEGATLRASFELRAGGYDGSTYELTYDPATDRLKGTYYQAVAKQKFDVNFVRK